MENFEIMIDKIRLGFGLLDYPFENGREFFKWAEFLEEHQIDSLWQSDRLVSTDPYLESLTALATLAGCTEKLKFGMNAIVAPLRDPLVLAKQCATIDYLSGGRLLPMFGVGYPHAVEWGTTGRSSDHRGSKANEMFQLLTKLWTEDKVSFEGKFFSIRMLVLSQSRYSNHYRYGLVEIARRRLKELPDLVRAGLVA